MKPEKAQEAITFFEELLKEGIITEKDFQDKKNDILNLVEKTQTKAPTGNSDHPTTTEPAVLTREASGSISSEKRPLTEIFSGSPPSSSSLLQRTGSNGNMVKRRSQDHLSSPGSSPTSSSSNSLKVSDLLGTADLGRMDILRKMSLSNQQDFAELQKFINLDKEFDNEEKVLEFIRFLMDRNQLPPMATQIIKQEIDINKNGLLREESLGSSLLRNYWFNYEGKDYLKTVIAPLVKEVNTLKKPLEIDPNKGSPELALKNLNKLLEITKTFLSTFCRSLPLFPVTFRLLMKNFYIILTETEGSLKAHLGLGYSEDALRLYGSFLLLRFICPAIVSPRRYGLIKGEVTTQTQRALVLISKVLQSIASQVEFEGEKEPYMIPANEFVKDNMPPLLAFFQKLADGSDVPEIVKISSPPIQPKKDKKDKWFFG